MPPNLGAETRHGWGLEGTYDTAVAATAKVNSISNGLDVDTIQNLDVVNCGVGGRRKNRKGVDMGAGPIVIQWTYDLQEPWLESLAGTYADNLNPLLDTYTFDTRADTTFTYAEHKRDAIVHEYSGCSVDSAVLTGDASNDLRWTLATMFGTRTITGTVNTAASLALLALPANDVLYTDMVMRIGDLGDVLGAVDVLNPEAFTMTFGRNKVQSITNLPVALQAEENGKQDHLLTIDLPRIETDQFITWKEAGTLVQCELDFTSGTDQKVLRFPCGVVETAPQTTDDDTLQTMTIGFRFFNNLAADNAFTGFDFDESIRAFELGP